MNPMRLNNSNFKHSSKLKHHTTNIARFTVEMVEQDSNLMFELLAVCNIFINEINN